jgi:hypothetical protein
MILLFTNMLRRPTINKLLSETEKEQIIDKFEITKKGKATYYLCSSVEDAMQEVGLFENFGQALQGSTCILIDNKGYYFDYDIKNYLDGYSNSD